MIQVEFSQAAISGSTLRIGCVVRYGKGGPVRFAQVVVDEDVLQWGDLDAILTFASRATNRYLDREREIEQDASLPGM